VKKIIKIVAFFYLKMLYYSPLLMHSAYKSRIVISPQTEQICFAF